MISCWRVGFHADRTIEDQEDETWARLVVNIAVTIIVNTVIGYLRTARAYPIMGIITVVPTTGLIYKAITIVIVEIIITVTVLINAVFAEIHHVRVDREICVITVRRKLRTA